MKWDDELESLAKQVHEIFGEGAVAEAYVRVLLQHAPESSEARSVMGDPDQVRVGMASATRYMDGRITAGLLKAELRRMLRPH